MTRKPASTRKWSVVIAIIATCCVVGYGVGYLIGKFL